MWVKGRGFGGTARVTGLEVEPEKWVELSTRRCNQGHLFCCCSLVLHEPSVPRYLEWCWRWWRRWYVHSSGGVDAETQASIEAARGRKPHHRIWDISGTEVRNLSDRGAKSLENQALGTQFRGEGTNLGYQILGPRSHHKMHTRSVVDPRGHQGHYNSSW